VEVDRLDRGLRELQLFHDLFRVGTM
jgi:hypothetical protein